MVLRILGTPVKCGFRGQRFRCCRDKAKGSQEDVGRGDRFENSY